MATNHFIAALCFGLFSGCLSIPDECINHATFENSRVRTAALPTEVSSLKCDRAVPEGWYKILPLPGARQHGDILWVRSNADAPNVNTCGTEYPLFIVSGTSPYPSILHEKKVDVPLTARLAPNPTGFLTLFTVDITKCQGFNVYKLKSIILSCNIGYCFSEDQPCPAGQTSETGFPPGCSEDLPRFKNGTLEVNYEVVDNELAFDCTRSNIKTVSGNQPPNLRFRWYMQKRSKVMGSRQLIHEVTVAQNFNPADAQLRQSHWINRMKLGVEITCEMSGVSANNIAGPPLVSEPFYAGLEVVQDEGDTENVYVLQGDGSDHAIKVRATVPILCLQPIQPPNQCQDKLRITILTENKKQTACTSGQHSGSSILLEDTACGSSIDVGSGFAELPSTDIKVIGRRGVLYKGNDEAALKIGVAIEHENGALKHWYHELRDLTIKIINVNSGYSNYTCEIFNDPHIRTFARTLHFDVHVPGTYTVYKHSYLPIEVQGRFEPCPWNPTPSCVCGVAVRSGKDVFIHDYCKKKIINTEVFNQYLRTGVVGCDNKGMEIDDYQNGGFKVTLPTGTVVWLPKTVTRTYRNSDGEIISYLDMGSLRLTSAPQDYGHESIEGLCGVIPGRSGTDLKMKDGTLTTDTNRFGEEWRIKSEGLVEEQQRDLFQYPGRVEDVFSLPVQCTCDEDEGVAECEVNKAGTRCIANTPVDVAIICETGRGKRDTHNGQFNEFADGAFIFPVYSSARPPPPTWRNTWTEVRARTYCTRFLTSKNPPECRQIIGDELQAKVQACVEDIKLTGDTFYAQTTLETTLQSCLNKVTYNNDLWVPSQNGDLAPSPALLSKLCPSACNLRGRCNNGVCQCTGTYSGAACELDLSIKPSNLRLLNDGYCDLSRQECDQAIIYGTGFHSNGQPVCNIRKTTAQGELLYSTQVTPVIVSSGKAICPLPTNATVISRDRASVHGGDSPSVYHITISTDRRRGGSSYSDSVTMRVVDGTCVDRSSFPNQKRETCMIGNVCHGNIYQSTELRCLLCLIPPRNLNTIFRTLLRTVSCGTVDYDSSRNQRLIGNTLGQLNIHTSMGRSPGRA